MSNFAHLHCHSHYSLLDGASSVSRLLDQAYDGGMTALALTDHGNLHGSLDFYREAKKRHINPILGYEAYIAPGSLHIKTGARSSKAASYHLTLLAKNRVGFQNLIKMASIASLQGFYYKPRIDKELLAAHSEGIICLSGCVSSEFSRCILDGKENTRPEWEQSAIETAQWFQGTFGEDYYVEIMNNGLEIQRNQMEGAVDIANKLGMPLVATSDAHYATQADAEIQDVLLCVNTRRKLNDPDRMQIHGNEFHIRTPEEMYAAFPGHEDAVKRSQAIADSVDIELELGNRYFPVYDLPKEVSPDAYLREVCMQGINERYDNVTQEILDRLDRELGVIEKLGFANYFLIVWDFVRYSREHGVPNNARGSGVGSIVCYALYISHACPLEHNLLFERFLDESRLEAPDIDIDFCKKRRGLIIDYVKEKYGEDSVAQIGTFGTLAARMALKDVCRVLDVPYDRVAELIAMIPDDLGITLKEALEQSEEFEAEYQNDSLARKAIDIAMRLEGNVRNVGTHAAAVVISDGPLTNYVPLLKAKDGTITTQWEMNDVESAGLLKMDFLGLRNLTILTDAVQTIKENHGVEIDLQHIPMDDPEAFALLQRGETKGVFQLESPGIRELLQRMKPDHFDDIVATNALYRPGPLKGGMVDEYVEVKRGRKQAKYVHPVLTEILGDTHGVMVYQEQIMKILNQLGGIPLAKAYTTIKAISKKKEEVIASNEQQFMDGSVSLGLSRSQAAEIWNMILQFAAYGFNKSHSVAYAQVSYQTAYLKAHYPLEFMAALLSADIPGRNFTKRDSLVEHLDDCRRMGIEVLPPCVNRSHAEFATEGSAIRFGLSAVKSCGAAVDAIVQAERPFVDVFDFGRKATVGKSVIEALASVGAFDSLHDNRAEVFNVAAAASRGGKASAKSAARGQMVLFGDVEDMAPEKRTLPRADKWLDRELLAKEKEMLGYYMSAHPLDSWRHEVELFSSLGTDEVSRLQDRDEIMLAGMITAIKNAHTKQRNHGEPTLYAKFLLEDYHGNIECALWPDAYASLGYKVAEDRPVVVAGSVRRFGGLATLNIDEVWTIQEAGSCHTNGLHLELRCPEAATPLELSDTLRKHPGNKDVFITANGVCMLSRKHKVELSPQLMHQLERFGSANVLVSPRVARIKRERSYD